MGSKPCRFASPRVCAILPTIQGLFVEVAKFRTFTAKVWPKVGAAFLLLSLSIPAYSALVRGKVAMEDGSAPGKAVGIERFCQTGTQQVAVSDRKGVFLLTFDVNPMMDLACVLRANLSGYVSSEIEISSFGWLSDPNLPPLVLRRRPAEGGEGDLFTGGGVPAAARRQWDDSARAARSHKWAQAERDLVSVVQAAPKFAGGWYALGYARAQMHKPVEAQEALRHALERDPKMTDAYLLLARVSIQAHDWQAAIQAAGGLRQADPKKPYPEIDSYLAVARYSLRDFDDAEAAASEGIRLDQKRAYPRNEYLLGVILEVQHNYEGAREHLSRYLELDPNGPDAKDARTRLPNLGKGEEPALAEEFATVDPITAEGEAWVPGGRKALAAIAHLAEVPSYADFFPRYCRALADEMTIGSSRGIPNYAATVRAYLAAITSLSALGERHDDRTTITLSVATDAGRKQTEQVLQLLGWRLTKDKDGSFSAEPGNLAADGPRQQIPAALGIDEISLRQALEAGRAFQFDIPTESAQFVGSDAWSQTLKDVPVLPPGGIAGVMAADGQLAKTCAGLGSMAPQAAAAVISAVGIRNLATRYSYVLARYGAAFAVGTQGVATPGGPDAEPAWRRLAGASPRNPPAFFRALVEKQQGELAAFYSALSKADEARQRFFTRTPQRAERFFAWYRQGEEFRNGPARQRDGWRTEFFRDLPLDANGNVRFPGGKGAWAVSAEPDDDLLLSSDAMEALAPLAGIEAQRKTILDEGSARLLAQHFAEWRPLFPYFDALPALGAGEFQALAHFAATVADDPPAQQNAVLGEWYSLLEMIDRGVKAGALDGPASARAFRRICTDLLASDHALKAWSALRELAGGGADLRESVPGHLLRVTGARRDAFDRVLQLQRVPRIEAPDAPDPARVLAALSGYVYAASFDPDTLLLNQDAHLVSRHRFLGARPGGRQTALFLPSAVIHPADGSGVYLSGGFGNIAEVAAGLARATPAAPVTVSAASPAPSPLPAAESDASSIQPDFRITGRLLEVYATVTDSRGRYLDDLTADQFTVLDESSPQRITAFEPQASEVSCVLLLDTTGSMLEALPSLKNAALKLIGDLRPADSVAVYSFNESVTELQSPTTDKTAAQRAVLRAQAMGNTALYDALTRVSLDLTGVGGKKVIVVFTDGKDNASAVTSDSVITRAKAAGVPVYTIAEGEAVTDRALIAQLAGISQATGGQAFVIRGPGEIGQVFEKVSEDLAHGYLLSFPPPPAAGAGWRAIEVQVRAKGAKVRAREGYFPQ